MCHIFEREEHAEKEYSLGTTRWADSHYTDRKVMRSATGTPTFAYHADVASGKTAAKVHEKLDPKGVSNRESCDSDTHPHSRAVAVLFDVTGSMARVPHIMQEKLPQLMGLLLRKGYLDHPHVLIGAIGDATCDRAPLQIGQFEAGIEIENDLTNLYLEGGGGGQVTESYELGMYFMSRHTKLDCFDKRGEKGYLFIVGDEMSYKMVKKSEVSEIIGDSLQADIAVEDMMVELKKKYEVYFVLPNMTSHYNNPEVNEYWKRLAGQNFLKMEDPAGICELIAATIGLNEGKVDIDDLEADLKEAGASLTVSKAVSGALVPVGEGKLTKKKGTDIAVAESGAGSGIATL